MSKVTFTEAATAAGVHFNTLRNWRKANKLTTAEKVVENGVEIWVVELSEVEQLARQSRHKRLDNNKSNVDGPTDELPPIDVPGPREADNNSLTTNPITLVIGEAVDKAVKPLAELIEKQGNQIGELKEELGTLKERLRNTEAQLEAAQAARDAARLAESPPPVRSGSEPQIAPERPQSVNQLTPEPFPILHRDTFEPITEPVKKGFWQRLFGG